MADVRGGGSDPLAREFELISKWALDHGLEGTHEWDWPCAALSRIEDAAEALRVERDTAVDALRQIASGEFVTKAVSDPLPAFIDGKETTVTYAERLTARQIAQQALAAVGGAASMTTAVIAYVIPHVPDSLTILAAILIAGRAFIGIVRLIDDCQVGGDSPAPRRASIAAVDENPAGHPASNVYDWASEGGAV